MPWRIRELRSYLYSGVKELRHNSYQQHALKGQKLLAQGNALGINDIQLTPCKGKSFTYRREFSIFIRCILKLLPLQGAKFANMITQGAALG